MARTLAERPRWEAMDKSDLPLDVAVEHYLTACRTEGKTPKTLFDYECKLARYLQWHGEGSIGDLDVAKARTWVLHLQGSRKWATHPDIATSEQTLSPQTVASHVRTLKGFATWLYEEEYLPENVLRRLAKPRVPQRITEVLSPAEVARLLGSIDVNSASGARNHAIVVLFLDTGLRLSELVGLQNDDVHIKDSWLKVFGKGGKERIVPFGARTTKVLNRYASFYRPDDSISDTFFVNENGSPFTENALKQVFKRLQVRANLPRLHPHLLRHTFATSYLLAGGDVFSLQAILGHTTLEMTRRYVNLASAHVAIQQKRFSPMDRLSSGWSSGLDPVRNRTERGHITTPSDRTVRQRSSMAPSRRQ